MHACTHYTLTAENEREKSQITHINIYARTHTAKPKKGKKIMLACVVNKKKLTQREHVGTKKINKD